jgi:hypothetical protein
MNKFKYTLEPYNGKETRYICPDCLEEGQFTKYIDVETNEYLGDTVGRCNREDKCGYHYTPKEFFLHNDFGDDKSKPIIKKSKKKIKPKDNLNTSFIDADYMYESLLFKEANCLFTFLIDRIEENKVLKAMDAYKVGTSFYWKGATVFWQIDKNNKIRAGKIMLYDASNGKRVKKPYNHINWVHKVRRLKDFNLNQCLFGEHLLCTDENKPVAIVESEKTAIISSIHFPEFIWLASGNVNNLNIENTKVLAGRDVALFPDINSFDKWKDKIPKLNPLANYEMSTLLEEKATEEEKKEGLDLADYLLI